jgi:PAS domain S-box-containing protein
MPSAVAPDRRAAAAGASPTTALRGGGSNLPFAVLRLRRDGTLLHAGPGAAALTGHDAAALSSPRFALRLVSPEDRRRLAAALREVAAAGHAALRLRVACADGTRRPLDLHLAACGDGTLEAVAFAVDEAAERARAEARRLRARYDAAEPVLRNAALTSPDGLAFLERTVALLGRTAGADRARALLAGDGETLIAITCWTGAVTDLPEPIELDPAAWPALGEGQAVRVGPEDGAAARALLAECTCAAAVLVPFQDEADRFGAFLLEWLDDGRAWARAEVRALARLTGLFETLWAWMGAEARYRQTIADLEDGLFSFAYDLDGRRRYAFVTPQFEALTGCAADALVGDEALDWPGLVHDDDRAAFEAHEAALRAGDPSRLVYRLRRPDDGAVRWLRESATPGRSPSGRPVVGGLVSDVTEQKRAEATLVQAKQAAEHASAAKTAFLTTMSHELRSPLGALRGFAELLQEEARQGPGDAEPSAIAEFADIIAENAQRALHLVHHLFDLSRLETGALDLRRVPVALHPAVERVLVRYRAEAEAKGLGLHFAPADGDPDGPLLLADPDRVEEVVAHLVSNAVKFTEVGGVRVATFVGDGAVRLVVEDTGIGIAEAYLERLFEPFTQEDYRLNRTYGGSGLGLAITRRLLDGMDGAIRVESTKGKGSRFEVTFGVKGD